MAEGDAGVKHRPQRQRWRLETSVWAPRKATSNSRDFYETEAAMRKMYDVHWQVRRRARARERRAPWVHTQY